MRFSILILIILVVAGIVAYNGMFVVDEKSQAFVTQFGDPVGEPITEPGLNFKIPVIQQVRLFEKRFLDWDGERNRVMTADERYIEIDTFARWRIEDPVQFYQSVINEQGAQERLDGILNSAARTAVADHKLVEIIRSQEREAKRSDEFKLNIDADVDVKDINIQEKLGRKVDVLEEFKIGRDKIATQVEKSATQRLSELGIELLDFRFKRINYGSDIQQNIFDRMRSERQMVAQLLRSRGEGKAAEIRGDTERQLQEIKSEASRKVKEIRGKADARAAEIYAKAYDQSESSREFYEFDKTLETYTQTLSEKDRLIFSTDSDFYRFLKTAKPNKSKAPETKQAQAPAGAPSE